MLLAVERGAQAASPFISQHLSSLPTKVLTGYDLHAKDGKEGAW